MPVAYVLYLSLIMCAVSLNACRSEDAEVGSVVGPDEGEILDPPMFDPLRDVYVSGLCSSQSSNHQLELSVLLRSPVRNILPSSRVEDERKYVNGLLKASDFEFSLPATSATDLEGDAYLTQDQASGASVAMSITPVKVEYEYVGGEDQKDAKPYVIFLLDQSASHIGMTETDLNPSNSTDYNGVRLSFFNQLLQNLPEHYYASVIAYQGNEDDATSADTLATSPLSLRQMYETEVEGEREELIGVDILLNRLSELTSNIGLKVGTPMRQALKSTLRIAKEARDNPPNVSGLSPVVILYTDGVEGGDTSTGPEDLSEIAAMYKAEGIPVHIVHLNLPFTFPEEDRVRSSAFAELACQTGGDYHFLERSETFYIHPSLLPMIESRTQGRWKLTVESDFNNEELFPSQMGYLLSTELKVTLGQDSKTYSLRSDGRPDQDTRVWVYKD